MASAVQTYWTTDLFFVVFTSPVNTQLRLLCSVFTASYLWFLGSLSFHTELLSRSGCLRRTAMQICFCTPATTFFPSLTSSVLCSLFTASYLWFLPSLSFHTELLSRSGRLRPTAVQICFCTPATMFFPSLTCSAQVNSDCSTLSSLYCSSLTLFSPTLQVDAFDQLKIDFCPVPPRSI